MPAAKPGARRLQILQVMARMLENPKGEKVTTAALAKELDVSEAALYRHFASKAQMFEGLIEFIEQTLFGLVNKITAEEESGLKQIQAAANSIIKLRNSQNAFTAVDPNPRAPKAYPICTFTWAIVPLKTSKAPELKRFIDWALTKGQSLGPKLLFVPLPDAVKKQSRKTLTRIHT